MDNKLIIVYGSSPGAGKSTIAAFLYEQLGRQNDAVAWLYEEDVLYHQTFAQALDHFRRSHIDQIPGSFLEASATFVDDILQAGTLIITDSILPYFNWLLATDYYSLEQIARFRDDLARLLALLRPLIIYLDVDSKTALQRATHQRGQPWYDELQIRVNRYGYNQTKEVKTLADVAAYFDLMNRRNLSLLDGWSCDQLRLNTTTTPIAVVKKSILDHIGLVETPSSQTAILKPWSYYLGLYQAQEEDAEPHRLEVTPAETGLKVNAYWPNGCRLVAESEDRFRLQDTSLKIEFDIRPGTSAEWLTFNTGAKIYRYERISTSNTVD